MVATKINNTRTKSKPEVYDFSDNTIYVGLDVHKKTWSVSVYLNQQFIQTFSQPASSKALQAYLHKNFPNANYFACYESGFCGFSVQRELKALNIHCDVVNAADIPQTQKSIHNKTDKSDSKRIAEAYSNGMLNPIYVPTRAKEADRSLVRYRKKMQQLLAARRKAIKSTLFCVGIEIPENLDKAHISKAYIAWLKGLEIDEISLKHTLNYMIEDVENIRKRLLTLNREIKTLSQTEQYKALYELITSVPGIGIISAMTIITEIFDINRFDSFKKINSFVGLCPSQYSSGEKDYKGNITTRHNKAIRQLLIEAAWIAKRKDPSLAAKYQTLIKRQTGKRAIVVIAKKLLARIYAVWKDGVIYQNGYQ